ncbi:hypothetical protein MIZ03_3940 [Rhodoferax lithotrophicus]|uniref:Uncharacterized protein n=1 Tax=Rhodoferax lithotrophicus TaxID=2798804 RepID=A0ABN6DDI8_9BURK|nr:hypothetical protein MIZ03_3940 [Rhodoferax sp. MIZ03]
MPVIQVSKSSVAWMLHLCGIPAWQAKATSVELTSAYQF